MVIHSRQANGFMRWLVRPQAALCLLALWVSLDLAAEPRTVRVGLYQNSPKVNYTAQGGAEGIFVDILAAIAEKEGWTLQYVPGTWSDGLARLANGDIDLLPDTALTEERQLQFAFHSEPVLSQWNQMYARRGSGIRSLIDLKNKRVAVLSDSIQLTYYVQMVEGFDLNTTIIRFRDFAAAFSAVAKGEADAVVASNFYGATHAPAAGLEGTAIVFGPSRMYYATAVTANRPLLQAIDRHLADFKKDADSVYYQSLRRWSSDTVRTVLPAWFGSAATIAGVLLLASLAWIVTLRRAAARLRASEQQQRTLAAQLQRMFEFSVDAICTFDRHGHFLHVSAASERILGYKPEELIGRSFTEYVAPEDHPKTIEAGARAFAGETLHEFENRNVRKDGSIATIVWSARWSDAEQTLFCVGRDVSERKQLLAELQRRADALERTAAELAIAKEAAESSDRLKSAFLATMSHELRTPLNSIIGFTGILGNAMAGPINPEQKKQLGMVGDSARHLLALINDVLDISKIEAGQLAISTVPFHLPDSLVKAAAIVKPLADKKGLALNVQIAPDVGEMRADARRVEQIVLNLLSNAVKFTDDGSVTLDAGILDAWQGHPQAAPCRAVRVRIIDTGIGIEPGDLAQLFKPFHQIDATLSRAHEGTGLGLAICQRLAGLMGGMVTVQSAPRQGSTFTVTLPLCAPARGQAHAPAQEAL